MAIDASAEVGSASFSTPAPFEERPGAIAGAPQHDATAAIARLVQAAKKATETRDRTTLLRVVNG